MHVVYTAAHRKHDPHVEFENSTGHAPFEHGGRAEAIRASLAADERFTFTAPDAHGIAPIEAVHDPGLVRFLRQGWSLYQDVHGPTRDVVPDVFYRPAIRRGMTPGKEPAAISGRFGWWCFETTTPLTEGTFEAACAAVDTALTTADLVVGGSRAAYGLCRPPGHHATSSMYGGYCFFNNAAVAAHHLATATGAKITVLDVDYHHGNGTQEIFYERGDVQYISLHGDPVRAYPYNIGHADETGGGAGAGANLNLPLPAAVDDDTYLGALESTYEAIAAFHPSVLVVSLGLDTYVDDPICDFALTADGFAACGASVGGLGLPTVILQEGGYAIDALGDNVRRWLLGFEGIG